MNCLIVSVLRRSVMNHLYIKHIITSMPYTYSPLHLHIENVVEMNVSLLAFNYLFTHRHRSHSYIPEH